MRHPPLVEPRRAARPTPFRRSGTAFTASLPALVALLLTLLAGGCRSEPAFTVDGRPIPVAEVEAAATLAGVEPDDPVLLEQLINQELLLHDAEARGIRIDEDAVARELAALADGVGGVSALREQLAARGVPMSRFRDDLRVRLALQAYADALAGEAPISDAQVRDAFERDRERFAEPERWGVTLLRFPDAASAEAARDAILAGAEPVSLLGSTLEGSGPLELSESDSSAERAALLDATRSTPFGSPVLVPEPGRVVAVVVPERYYRATTPTFEALEPTLRAQLEQRATQEALAARLATLRARSEIRWQRVRPATAP